MNKNKEIGIGIAVGIIANILGTLAYIWLFTDIPYSEIYEAAVAQDQVGSLLALGAILNLIAFFAFLKIGRDLRAKGVLIATIITALIILVYKVF